MASKMLSPEEAKDRYEDFLRKRFDFLSGLSFNDPRFDTEEWERLADHFKEKSDEHY